MKGNTTIASNLKKQTIVLGKNGEVISESTGQAAELEDKDARIRELEEQLNQLKKQ